MYLRPGHRIVDFFKNVSIVEVMIVVAMLGLLAALAIPSFAKARQEALLKQYPDYAEYSAWKKLAGGSNLTIEEWRVGKQKGWIGK